MNQISPWLDRQSADSLARVETLFSDLKEILDEELVAISQFQLEAIDDLSCRKEHLLTEFETISNGGVEAAEEPANSDENRNLKLRISRMAGQVRAMLRANSALMEEAIATMTAKIGLERGAQSYDRRARTSEPVRRPSLTSL